MTDSLESRLERRRIELQADQAKLDLAISELAEAARRREERNSELLEQITKQLASIESLLRAKA
jgi:hypothetical protein